MIIYRNNNGDNMLDLICGFNKLTMVDFDGKMSATIFLGACNFRCPFCHNSSLVLDPNDNDKVSFEEIYDYLKKRRGILEAVCITGGEPTLYPDLKEMIKKIKELGYLVKLDTNGTNPSIIKELYKEGLIDYIAMDIKNSYKKYPITAGKKSIDNEAIKESIEFLLHSGVDYEFRTTIVNELHAIDDMKEIAQMIKGAKRYFLQMFVDNGSCIAGGLHKVEIEDAKAMVQILKKDIEYVALRGYE